MPLIMYNFTYYTYTKIFYVSKNKTFGRLVQYVVLSVSIDVRKGVGVAIL